MTPGVKRFMVSLQELAGDSSKVKEDLQALSTQLNMNPRVVGRMINSAEKEGLIDRFDGYLVIGEFNRSTAEDNSRQTRQPRADKPAPSAKPMAKLEDRYCPMCGTNLPDSVKTVKNVIETRIERVEVIREIPVIQEIIKPVEVVREIVKYQDREVPVETIREVEKIVEMEKVVEKTVYVNAQTGEEMSLDQVTALREAAATAVNVPSKNGARKSAKKGAAKKNEEEPQAARSDDSPQTGSPDPSDSIRMAGEALAALRG